MYSTSLHSLSLFIMLYLPIPASPFQYHRITEHLRLEETARDQLVQPPLLKQVAQDHVQSAFEYLQG